MRSSFFYFKFQELIFPLISSSSCLRLLLFLLVPPILPYFFPSIMSFRRQFLRKMQPNQLALIIFEVCKMFPLILTVLFISHTIGATDLLHLSPAPHSRTIQEFLIYFSTCRSFSTIRSYAPNVALLP